MEINENYTDKSFIVYGETKPWKTQLKEMKGRFNTNLELPDGKGAGWVFSKKYLENVKEFVENHANENKIDETPQIGQEITFNEETYHITFISDNKDIIRFDNGEDNIDYEARIINGLWMASILDPELDGLRPVEFK